MDFDHALPASGSEEFFDQPQGLEDLQGARMNDGRSIPVERRRLGIDHVAGHASAAQVGGEEQAGWAGSDDEHCGLMACVGLIDGRVSKRYGCGWELSTRLPSRGGSAPVFSWGI